MEKKNQNTYFNVFTIVFFSSFLFWGLFKENAACLYSGFFALLYFISPNKITLSTKDTKKWIQKYPILCIILLFTISYFMSVLIAIDKGMALIGAIKVLGILFFYLCFQALEKREQKQIEFLLPGLGAAMVLIGLVSLVIPNLYDYFYVARRLGGFLQYPNTFAMFLLICVAINMEQSLEENSAKENEKTVKRVLSRYFTTGLCLLGILMSGSRSVYVMMLCYFVFVTICHKEIRRKSLLLILVAVGFSALYVLITKDVQNMGRIFTSSYKSSTFLGRILYAKDALQLIIKHPLGMGYLGYYYEIPLFQKGVYLVRFVHNDLLQIMLDIGIVPGVLVSAGFFYAAAKKTEMTNLRKLLLILYASHLLFDFDMEFVSMAGLLFMLMAEADDEFKIADSSQTAVKGMKVLSVVAGLLCIYVGVAMSFRYDGRQDISVKLLPFYTEAKAEIVAREVKAENLESPVLRNYAEQLRKKNQRVRYAYLAMAQIEKEESLYDEMCRDVISGCKLNRYQISTYEQAIMLLAQALSQAGEEGKLEDAERIMATMIEIDEIKNQTEKNTDPLAYEIKDVPNLEYSNETKEYIEYVKLLNGVSN